MTPENKTTDAATRFSELDDSLAELRDGAERWGALTVADRRALLQECRDASIGVAEEWTRAACEIKGIAWSSPVVGEEWLSGPYAVITGLSALIDTLRSLAEGRGPIDRARVQAAPGDRSAVRVLPTSVRESLLMNGFTAEVWSRPGVNPTQFRARAGLGIDAGYPEGGVGVVLGAGNITSIAPLDVFYELVAYGRTALLKLNPILAGMHPVLSEALAPLIREGYLRIVEGGADVGAYLTAHEGIDHVHITGSAATHDAIVWGTGEEAKERRTSGSPKLAVPITSELGGVSPIIVVPGTWSDADLRYQAENVATMRLHNAGHNCIAGQVVLLSEEWPQRDAFIAELEAAIARAPERSTWYPGAAERVAAAAERPGADVLGQRDGRVVVCPTDEDTTRWIESTEIFAPVLGLVGLPGAAGEFLQHAIRHANDKLAGTLGANIIIDPATQRGIRDFDEQLAQLRYGTIGVNVWTALGFLTARATWGGFPGATLTDVESGIGIVHNAFLLDDVERTVVRGPFRPFPRSVLGGELSLFPTPPWFVSLSSGGRTARALTTYAEAPSWRALIPVFASAFRP